MYVPRPSILQRPVREGSRANEEKADSEYAREQARLAAKTQRLAAAEERMVGAFYATAEEKRRAWAHAHREAEQLAAARAQAAAAHATRDAQWAAQPQRVVVDTRRPWNAASTTYYMPAEVEAEARRRQQREAAEANRAAVQYRAAAEARARAAEQAALHAAMAAEDTYFNLGAASERWIPPERRVKQRAAVPAQFAQGPPPYCCDTELEPSSSRPASDCSGRSDAGSVGSYAAPARGVAMQRPVSASRRALEGQGVAAALRCDDTHAANAVTTRVGSYSSGRAPAGGGAGSGGAAPAPARPQTAPAQRRQPASYPWSWNA
ncbi:hypothetical protein ABPG77_006525 [Micractinium sp. CCAP 211/92]